VQHIQQLTEMDPNLHLLEEEQEEQGQQQGQGQQGEEQRV
jgi:hypothetical protein